MSGQRNAILTIAQRYEYNAEHAHQVECLAGTLFMEMELLHNLEPHDRKLLEYAAILHDIGYFVEARGHHRHGLQMVMMEPLPEFSREEKLVIANLVRYHRKTLPTLEHTAFGVLSDADKKRVLFLAPLLRIADALDRSHARPVQELSCEILDDSVALFVGTEGDIPVEIAAVARKVDMFRQVYRRDIEIVSVQPRLPGTATPAEFAFEGVR